MRKNIFIMIIACCAAMTASAATDNVSVKDPQRLKAALIALYDKYGDLSTMTIHTKTNPDTDMMEESTFIIPIKVPKDDPLLQEAIRAFMQDMDYGYQFCHIVPGEKQNVEITMNTTEIIPREKISQEMWLLNAKNPNNPALRDNYTLVLDSCKDNIRAGKVYIVTSMCPNKSSETPTDPFGITINDGENSINIQKIQQTLAAYQCMLETTNDQIEYMNKQGAQYGISAEMKKEMLQKLYNEANDIIAKMKALVDKYAETISKNTEEDVSK